jgi:23S rRNA pseudouridine2457 synthase
VEGIPEKRDLEKLKHGIVLKDRKTLPAEAEIISNPNLPPRYPSIRFRKNIPDCWLKIILTEGKNRQVRRMTAAIGFPTLRLVRVRMENIKIGNMNPGEVRALDEKELAGLIKIKKAVK